MKKRLLCALTCVSMLLVACSGGKEGKGTITKYKDQIELGEYKGLELTKTEYEITDQDLQDKIDAILDAASSVEQIKEGKVKNGDTLNINYTGKINGEAFDGGTAHAQCLTIGSGRFIPGFEEQLIGVKIGDTVDLNLKFPDDYNNEELKGKDCVFTVTVNYKEGERIVPEWNDNFVQGRSEFDTTKEYEQSLKEELASEREATINDELKYKAMDQLTASCTFNKLPQDEVDAYKESMVKYYTDYAKQYNMEYKEFIEQYFGYTEEQMDEQITKMAETSIKQKMICYSIGEKEDIIPKDGDMEDAKVAVAKELGFSTLEDFEKQYGSDLAEEEVVRETVLNWVIDNAKVTVVSPSEAVQEEAKTPATEEAK